MRQYFPNSFFISYEKQEHKALQTSGTGSLHFSAFASYLYKPAQHHPLRLILASLSSPNWLNWLNTHLPYTANKLIKRRTWIMQRSE